MAMTRFPLEQYATLELNQVAFPKTGMVVSQTPLGSAFTKDAPCENGMWVVADKAAGAINAPAAATDKPIGIVYTAEKEPHQLVHGMKHFAQKEGDYPRVGIMQRGDTFTSNCFDMGEYESADAIKEALEAGEAMFIIPVAGSAMPALAKAAPANGLYGQVIKYYTMPNGEPAIKYNIVRH